MIQIIRGRDRGEEELSLIIDLIEKYEGSAYATQKAKQYSKQAVDALKVFENYEKKGPLIELAEYVVERKS